MKSTLRILGITALAVMIGFSMTACPNGGGGSSSGGDDPGGDGGDGKPIPLTAGQWKHGELKATTTEVQYSFSVQAGKSYGLWWNDSGEGDGFKTGNIKVSAKWSDETELSPKVSGEDKGWTKYQKITSDTTKTVIITVEPLNDDSFGTYSIAYDIGNDLHGAGVLITYDRPDSTWDKPPANPTPLTENTWKNGTIDSSAIADWGWYTLSVTKDTKYNFWWDEKVNGSNGSGMFTGTIGITAYYSDGKTSSPAFSETDTAWTSAKSFTPDKNDTVYIRVRLYNSNFFDDTTYPGSYAIVYSTTATTRPAINLDSIIEAVQLVENIWKHGTITNSADTDWYKVSVTSGTTYNFWLSDSANNNIHTGDIVVTVYKNDQTVVIPEADSAWNSSKTYTPTEDGTLYINVKLNTRYSTTPGTYGIVYSTSETRPAMDLSKVEFITAKPLTEDTWENGEITSDTVQWYSMQVTSGSTYRLWTNEAGSGSSGNITKTGSIYVRGFYSDGSSAFTRDRGKWSYAISFTPSANDTVYIMVTPYSDTSAGTFGIAYTTTNNRPVVNFDADAASAVTLNVNQWTNGQINATSDTDWYKVTVESGKTYRIYFNDSADGDRTKTGNVSVYAYYSDWKDIDNRADGWDYPLNSFTPTANGTIYIRVVPYSSSGTTIGTYAIVCTTSSSRPLDTQGISATALTEKEWKDGALTETSRNVYYSFDASAGTTYYLWWDNVSQGGGTGKTASVYVSAYDGSDGVTLLNRTESGYTTAKPLTVTSAGKVYILVEPRNTNGTGTFGLVYSTANTRPINTQGINATALSADTWKYGQIAQQYAMNWYTLSVTSGTTYRFWVSERDNSGFYEYDVAVTGYYSDGSSAFAETNNAWTTPVSFVPTANGTLYINVKATSYSDATYSIVYSTSSARPTITDNHVNEVINATPATLTANQWQNDEITSQNRVFWYSFTVSAGTYYLWADGGSSGGSGSMTGEIKVIAYNSDGVSYFNTIYNAWNTSQTITVNSSNLGVGKVYLKVEAFYSSSNSGNGPFRVAYNTADTRPTP
jgi:hypothetical protein